MQMAQWYSASVNISCNEATYSVTGELKVDYDGEEWVDWDDAHGEIDTEQNREDHPQGFMYECCQGDGDSRGCKRGPHVSRKTSAKRSRY